MSGAPSLDLSKATKIKDLRFRWKRLSVQWITTTLRTIESKNLRHITIHPTSAGTIEEAVRQEWQDLDRLLVQFCWVRFLGLLWLAQTLLPLVGIGTSGAPLLDFSKATKIEDITFR